MSRKLALIIGNSEYEDKNLARLITPSADVNNLAAVLHAADIGGFDDVTTLVNEHSVNVRRAMARFFAQKMPDDLLLLYFSGHGVLDERGNLYLAVKDTERDLLSGSAIPASFITGEMDNSRSRRQVLVLDCCHSGAFARGTKGASGASVGTATVFEGIGYGRAVLTATDATQYAWEGDQVIGQAENSVFTNYLIEGLQSGAADTDGDGKITLDEWYDYVYAQVINKTPKQTPGKWTYKQQGELVIAKSPRTITSHGEVQVAPKQISQIRQPSQSKLPVWGLIMIGLLIMLGACLALGTLIPVIFPSTIPTIPITIKTAMPSPTVVVEFSPSPTPSSRTITSVAPIFTLTPRQPSTVPSTIPLPLSPTPTPFGGGSGLIAFASERDGNREIYVMNADGTGIRRLTNNPALDSYPTWSPDGKFIAFYSDRDGNDEIYVMNVDGTNQRRLTNDAANDHYPAWSPDGQHIAFTSIPRGGDSEIYIINADGTNPHGLTNNATSDFSPTWSPDGRFIAFTSERDGNHEIYVINADGTNQRRLTNNSASDSFPAWSPDGQFIAFQTERDGNREIYVINADGTNPRRLTNNAAVDSYPAWSPDGRLIAFYSNRDGNNEIYVMNADGTNQRRLTNHPSVDAYPSWQGK